MYIKKLELEHLDEVKELFKRVFMNEPWNDDWSNEKQLTNYMLDLMGNRNSLGLALCEKDEIVGISLGSIMHWCAGTEYYIYEFFITREYQNRGFGSQFLSEIEDYVKELGINHIYLQTDRPMPAYQFYKKNGFMELEEHASLVKMFE